MKGQMITDHPIMGVCHVRLQGSIHDGHCPVTGTCQVALQVRGISNPQIQREPVEVQFDLVAQGGMWTITLESHEKLTTQGFMLDAIEMLQEEAREQIVA